MTDVATLGLEVDSSDLADAVRYLDRVTEAGAKAERQADSFGRRADEAGRKAAAANDNAARSAEKTASSYDFLTGKVRMLGAAIIAAFGVTAGAGAFITGIFNAQKRLDDFESATRKIDRALQQNGYTWDLTTKKINAFAEALELRTGTSKMEVLDLAPNLASFGFTEKVALRSIELANDMAAAWGGDLRQNFEGLGRALADPIKGFAMLAARGITLDDTQKKLVKSLMESGQGLKAQEVVLQALEDQVKGIAEAGYTPLQKAQDAARRSSEAFFEKLISSKGIGDALITVLNGLARAITFATEHLDILVTALGIFAAGHIASGIMAVVGAVVAMTGAMEVAAVAARALSVAMAFAGGPVGLAVMALGAAYLLLRDNVSAARQATQDAKSAYETNAKAMAAAQSASEKYTQALRDQIVMQLEVAKAAKIAAEATYESALGRHDAFADLTGGARFAPFEYALDKADRELTALSVAVDKLESQLATVDSNLGKPADPTDRNFGSSGKADKDAEKAKKAYDRLVASATEFIRAQELEASVLGMTEQAANALRYEQDLLNEARRAGLKLTDADKQGFKALAEAMAEAEERTRVLTERFDFMKDLTKGFFNDFKNDLISNMSQGMSFWDAAWKAMGKAALNVLDKIVDKLLNDVLDAIFKVNSNSGSGGGGILGFLGGLFKSGGGGGGALTNLPLGAGLYAKGGVFDQSGVTAFAKGGIVERATVFPFAKGIGLMGEAGPEAIMPLRRGADGRLGVSMHGAANQNYANQNHPAPYVDNRVYNFTGTSEEFQQFKEFVVQRDAEFDQRAVGAVKGYYGAGNSI